MTRTVAASLVTLSVVMSAATISAQEPQVAAQPQESQNEQQMRQQIERQSPGLGAGELGRIIRGLRIAPVQLNVNRKDLALVGLGSYLVNAVGGCNDCHTNPSYLKGGNPFMQKNKHVNVENYLAGGASFGPFTSRNLTPDATSGLPAGLTYAKFLETMRTGKDQKQLHPQISPLLQVMPWPVYQDMLDRDLRAIYEYLRAIPHAEPAAAPPTTPSTSSGPATTSGRR
jgi:hypothetical protein